MDYKTILVEAGEARSADARLAFAVRFAADHAAHLVGVVQTGIQRYLYGTAPDGYMADLTALYADLRARAEQRATQFEALARQAGLASFECRIGDEETGYALAAQAQLADLAIVGQSDPDDPAAPPRGVPEYVALHAPCPVLVLPRAGTPDARFRRILVAWNASVEAARAVRQALPLLERASEVDAAMIGQDDQALAALDGPGLAFFLARHGVRATLWQQSTGDDIGNALLARAADWRADLVVMGCYGHSRLREVLLGGVSRAVLRSMSVPTLLAH